MQVSVPSLPYDDEDGEKTVSEKLISNISLNDVPKFPSKHLRWAIIHSDDYGYNDTFFSDTPVGKSDHLIDAHWSGDFVGKNYEEIADAGIIICLYNGMTTYVVPDFTYRPEYFKTVDGGYRTYEMDSDTKEELYTDNLYLCIYPYKHDTGTIYGNGNKFMHFHGRGTHTCMGNDNQSLFEEYDHFCDPDNILHFANKLERRFTLINGMSYLYKSPRNLDLDNSDLESRINLRNWDRANRTFR